MVSPVDEPPVEVLVVSPVDEPPVEVFVVSPVDEPPVEVFVVSPVEEPPVEVFVVSPVEEPPVVISVVLPVDEPPVEVVTVSPAPSEGAGASPPELLPLSGAAGAARVVTFFNVASPPGALSSVRGSLLSSTHWGVTTPSVLSAGVSSLVGETRVFGAMALVPGIWKEMPSIFTVE